MSDAVEAGLPGLQCAFVRLAGTPPAFRAQVDRAQWHAAPSIVRGLGGRLLTLWGSDQRNRDGNFIIAAAYALNRGLFWIELPLAAHGTDAPPYPDLCATFPGAVRLQRAVADLCGLHAEGAADQRPWLRHEAWPHDYYPLRREPSGRESFPTRDDQYEFVRVDGDGVHEFAVGPVHAGIIEPGHFRFSVVGEKVLRLEERLGYVHKGIEKRFCGQRLEDAARLAARVSGDSTVAYGWAYCAAAESACAATVPPRARWLRALALERERVANHLGDLGALGNDAAFSFGLAQFSRLREDWLRRNQALAGHRLLMDWIVPGGMATEPPPAVLAALGEDCEALEIEVRRIEAIYDGHAGLQDRFAGTGRLDTELARQLGLTGLAARASGLGGDLRADFPLEPYAQLGTTAVRATGGDVAARVAVRFAEVYESLRLIRALARDLPAGALRVELGAPPPLARGAGWVEGWRGEILMTIALDERALLERVHCHDPSWQNWPALEHAVIGNIVPDFPLINKSFNLSYSGQDL